MSCCRRLRGCAVKLIRCLVQSFQCEEIVGAIDGFDVWSVTVTNVAGRSGNHRRAVVYRGCEFQESLMPFALLDVIVSDDLVDEVVRVVTDKCATSPTTVEARIAVVALGGWYAVGGACPPARGATVPKAHRLAEFFHTLTAASSTSR